MFKNLSDTIKIIPPTHKNKSILEVDKYLFIFVGYLFSLINMNHIIRMIGKETAINLDAIAKYIPGIINKFNSILWLNA